MTDKQILAATVWLPKKQGQGGLIQDGYILTAAHNIEWSGGSEMASCNEFWEPVETRTRAKFAAKAVFVDLVSDVAVLCGSDDEDDYDKFISEVKPVCFSKSEAELSHNFPVRILTHKS